MVKEPAVPVLSPPRTQEIGRRWEGRGGERRDGIGRRRSGEVFSVGDDLCCNRCLQSTPTPQIHPHHDQQTNMESSHATDSLESTVFTASALQENLYQHYGTLHEKQLSVIDRVNLINYTALITLQNQVAENHVVLNQKVYSFSINNTHQAI